MKYMILILIVWLCMPVYTGAQIDKSLVFGPDETDSLLEVRFVFNELPAYGDSGSLRVEFKVLDRSFNARAVQTGQIQHKIRNRRLNKLPERPSVSLDKEVRFSLTAGPNNYFAMPDSLLVWEAPLDSGAVRTIEIPYFVRGVGQFDIALTETTRPVEYLQFRIVGQITEDGTLAFLGKYPPVQINPLGMHIHTYGDSLSLYLAGKKQTERIRGESWLEPFEIDMRIIPVLKVGQTSRVYATMKAVTGEIEEIQYEITRASNLKIDSISISQGDNPGEGEQFTCSFLVTPRKAGRSYLAFRVFGRAEDKRHNPYVGSEIDYHLVFDDDGQLLYMGEKDPFAIGYAGGMEGYTRTDKLVEYSETGYATRVERSKPDFRMERMHNQFIEDSISRARQQDSLDAEVER
ncbi:MAG: hypothetical protein GF404_12170 [candidate division Zixibacteria bacterium]|nr:hypothetical protein [candidate division Zixibacteria bacterium]